MLYYACFFFKPADKPIYADESPKPTKKPTKKPTRKPTTLASSGSSESGELTTPKPIPSKKPTRKKKETTTKAPSTTTKEPAMDYELISNDEIEENDEQSREPVLPEGCAMQFKPHETDCSMYYMCNYGTFYEQT